MGLNIFNPSSTSALRDKIYGNTNSGPSLDLQFAKYKSLEDYVTGKNLITFTRGSIGTYYDANGIIQTAATDEPRFDHDPITNESLGLLIEESRTNQFDDSVFGSGWGAINISKKSTNNPAPDDSNTAVLIGDSTSSGTDSFLEKSVDVTGQGIQTFTFYAKGTTTGQSAYVDYYDQGANYGRGSISLDSGLVTYVTQTGDAVISSVHVGNNWWRIQLTLTPIGLGLFRWRAGNNDSGDIYIWGAQLETGSFPTSYIPTSGSTVTRASDVVSITGTNFSSFWNLAQEGTLSWENDLNPRDQYRTNTMIIAAATGLGTFVGPVVGYWGSATNRYTPFTGGNGTGNWGIPAGGWTYGPEQLVPGFIKTAIAFKPGIGLSNSATSGVLGTAADKEALAPTADPTPTGLYIGYHQHVKRVTYFPERLPDATLQAITS